MKDNNYNTEQPSKEPISFDDTNIPEMISHDPDLDGIEMPQHISASSLTGVTKEMIDKYGVSNEKVDNALFERYQDSNIARSSQEIDIELYKTSIPDFELPESIIDTTPAKLPDSLIETAKKVKQFSHKSRKP